MAQLKLFRFLKNKSADVSDKKSMGRFNHTIQIKKDFHSELFGGILIKSFFPVAFLIFLASLLPENLMLISRKINLHDRISKAHYL